jgi:hypothetical protein
MKRRRRKSLVDVLNDALRTDDRLAPVVRIPRQNRPRPMPVRTGQFTPTRQSAN